MLLRESGCWNALLPLLLFMPLLLVLLLPIVKCCHCGCCGAAVDGAGTLVVKRSGPAPGPPMSYATTAACTTQSTLLGEKGNAGELCVRPLTGLEGPPRCPLNHRTALIGDKASHPCSAAVGSLGLQEANNQGPQLLKVPLKRISSSAITRSLWTAAVAAREKPRYTETTMVAATAGQTGQQQQRQ